MAGEQKPFKDEKTEKPTPKKKQKQRREGNVFMSQEMSIVIVIFLGAWVIRVFAPWILSNLFKIMTMCFNYSAWYRASPENFHIFFTSILLMAAKLLAPIAGLLIITGAISTLIQTGWVVSWKKAKWDISKLFKLKWKSVNFFQKDKAVELILNIFKLTLVGMVLFFVLKDSIKDWLPLMDAPVIAVIFFWGRLLFKVVMIMSAVMFLLALIDFFYKLKKYNDDMKMTKHEVKEEKKQSEGDPRIKAALKSKRMAFFRKIMMQAVPSADVIITNPTHIAVAVKYDAESMEAPQVTAKGIGKLAEKIREIARTHNIPLVENKPLAQVLFKTVEVGANIPLSLYKTVAEILAYVYKLKNRKVA